MWDENDPSWGKLWELRQWQCKRYLLWKWRFHGGLSGVPDFSSKLTTTYLAFSPNDSLLVIISIHVFPTPLSHPNRASLVLTWSKRVSLDRSPKWFENPVIWGFLGVSVVVDSHTAVLCVIKQRAIQLLFYSRMSKLFYSFLLQLEMAKPRHLSVVPAA